MCKDWRVCWELEKTSGRISVGIRKEERSHWWRHVSEGLGDEVKADAIHWDKMER